MTTNEKDRLDLRQAFEIVFADERLARIAMEAMPPIDYSQLATKDDVAVSATALRGEFAELKGDFAELRSSVTALGATLDAKIETSSAATATSMVKLARTVVVGQVSTVLMMGTWVTAVT